MNKNSRFSGYLFEPKEMYQLSHTSTGKATFLKTAFSKRTMYRYDNIHLSDGMLFSEPNGFPLLNPYVKPVDFEVYSYKNHKKLTGENQAIHFFLYDDLFRPSIWNNLEQTTFTLTRFQALFTPDFTLFVDRPEFVNKMNIYRSRFVGAYWQSCGYDVIPTASWGDKRSMDYSFESLPEKSVIAVCGVGVKWCREAYLLWQYGVRQLEERLSPTKIIVYGDDLEVPGLHTPIEFITDYITNYYRNDRKKTKGK